MAHIWRAVAFNMISNSVIHVLSCVQYINGDGEFNYSCLLNTWLSGRTRFAVH